MRYNANDTGSPGKLASDNSYTDDSRTSSTTTTTSNPELEGEDNNVLIDVVNVDKCDEKLIFNDYHFYPSARPFGQADEWPSGYRGKAMSPLLDPAERSLEGPDEASGDECERSFLIEPERDYRRPYRNFPKGFLESGSHFEKNDDGLLPTAVEDDDLCSAIRRMNSAHLMGVDAMEVDGPLDLSTHHR